MKTSNPLRIWPLTLFAFATLNSQLPISLSAAGITVNSLNDSGAGSLRQAIQTAANGDTINFSVNGVITLASGELFITNNLIITGPGATNLAVSGNNSNRVFEIGSNVTASVSGLTIRDGHAGDAGLKPPENGGGIYNAGMLTLVSCSVSNNFGGDGANNLGSQGSAGGGIYNSGTLSLTGCTLSSNKAGAGAPGRTNTCLYCNGGNGGNGGAGGGIFNSGTLALAACTLSGNHGGGGAKGGNGGGYGHGGTGGSGGNGGGIYNAGTLMLTACTLSSNGGGAGGIGGAARGSGLGGNGGSGGGIFTGSSARSSNLRNSLVAANSVGIGGFGAFGISAPNGTGPDASGSCTSQGHNLIGQTDGSSGFTNAFNNDLTGTTASPLEPVLGPLTNNGGATFTMAVLPGSPALDAGDDALLVPPFNLMTDQRGLPRKSGAHVDIGAFELVVAGTPPYLGSPKNLGNGAFQFSFISTPGASFTVLCATNVSLPLSNWAVLGAPTEIAAGQFQFTDMQATTSQQRFYLVRSP